MGKVTKESAILFFIFILLVNCDLYAQVGEPRVWQDFFGVASSATGDTITNQAQYARQMGYSAITIKSLPTIQNYLDTYTISSGDSNQSLSGLGFFLSDPERYRLIFKELSNPSPLVLLNASYSPEEKEFLSSKMVLRSSDGEAPGNLATG